MIPQPPFPATVPGLIRSFAERFGDSDALVREGQCISFNGLASQSAAVAKALVGLGVSRGMRIAVLAPPGPDFVVTVLAAARIGAVIGPLSTLYQAPELAWVLARGGFAHLIVADGFLNHDYLSRLEEALPDLAQAEEGLLFIEAAPALRTIHVIGSGARPWSRSFSRLLEGDPRIDDTMLASLEERVTPADPVCIIYTSGSTAEPKGVVHGHGPLVRHAWQMGTTATAFGHGDRTITTRAMFWVAGFVATLFYALANGTCLLLTSDGSAANVLRLIEAEGATGLSGDVGWFDVLRDSEELASAGYDIVRLDMDTAGVAKDGTFLSDHLVARFGNPVHHPSQRIARSYGMTETLGAHTSLPIGVLLPEDRPNWQGRPMPGVELRIVDPSTKVELPVGETGELLVRGYCLMLGFDGRERHETFDSDGFYATGDLCRVDEAGYLKFEARRGEMLKVHGANVSPAEVELAMTGLMGIEKAALVGLERDGETIPVAAVLMAPGRTLDEQAVTTELRRRLSSFKVPKRIVALLETDMPMTGSGKIRKPVLAALLAANFGWSP
ncbi:class I adenylate-forming enzyme family protein [Novosphingobium taihuense]|uniref:Acyl-CoA synthetase (AMP-forming)/AMP-acid ligase II n=1 Tax=Novosphingobium taihuense TaxID=260085 RepID=A0A7W7AEN4_9SPHN|nr:class I adenylate-forming enzyme family protein [Novosphingobium taihuense]MBB4615461.1 acyl-CoA synthetase (AMP-forming)/AMP-acid ligase II [Novosphingobium taihuense]TWH82091.1 acyl-CoA synthetase (AMP-forming)/AMP-acid ligase II [Novosphingobium taihuense]